MGICESRSGCLVMAIAMEMYNLVAFFWGRGIDIRSRHGYYSCPKNKVVVIAIIFPGAMTEGLWGIDG